MSERLEIELEGGFTDAKGVGHKRLVFGSRLTGADLVRADRDIGRVSPRGFECGACASALVEFGTLAPDEFRHGLLSLSVIEWAEVDDAFDRFRVGSAPGREAEEISDDTVRLAFGVRRGDAVYTDITFGRLLTGWDEVHADELGVTSIERNFYLIGRQVVRLSAADGAQAEGGLSLTDFEGMDADDITALKDAAERWYEGVLAAHMKKRFAATGEAGETGGETDETVN